MWNDNKDEILEIIDNVDSSNAVFPTTCPVCNKKDGHVYYHKHDELHSGVWVWCGSCQTFSHMSGIAPDWWKNPDFINDGQLTEIPDKLDENKEKLDRWINLLIQDNEKAKNLPKQGNTEVD